MSQLNKLAASGWLYAILDATNCPAVPRKVLELGDEQAVSLYRGAAEEVYWDVAPYLMRVNEAMLQWIIETLWQQPWGIFIMSKADLDSIRRHFRRFLQAQLPDGNIWYFRFYDPRMLAAYLPVCNRQELAAFFGQSRAFGVSSPPVPQATELPDTPVRAQVLKMFLFAATDAAQTPPFERWIVRPEQMEAFEAVATQGFRAKVQKILCNNFEDANAIPPKELDHSLRHVISDARHFGLETESQCATYAVCTYVFGMDFHRKFPAASQILTDAEFDPEQRCNLLAKWTIELLQRLEA